MSIRLTKELRQFRHSLEELAQSLGGKVVGYDSTGSGHVAFTVSRNDKKRKVFCAQSPSDVRWTKNGLREARRVLMAM